MERDKKAKIGATIGTILIIMLFIEPMIFNTCFMFIVLMFMLVIITIILLWWILYQLLNDDL